MDEDKFKQLLAKVKQLQANGGYDLSLEEDLSIAVMNLISLEEHFYFTSQKTGQPDYLDLLQQTREVRKQLLAKMIPVNEGETWCISKHLLAATMRLIEVGTKYRTDGKKQEANTSFTQAYKIYSLFWAVRLKLLDLKGVRKLKKPVSVEDLVNQLVDCCQE
ncbi:MAG: hypothetical protein UX99_C0018G0012 [Candidatus Amesbacteria bacterium GW2011_GWB1_47_26]|uniref:Uncharacterized protein n=1 Tax=Candidatus Amesbacteria bacterium GW2011_GWC2_45_19 TaxID=1618366 RepID=A0A0G1M580_9BACT|nr:MAG: hypothetical protein UX05_C0001G0043 [Candidatus Amesbacteria bacterium GW2011_GWC2_45_19]KKU38575.1 MAG: hypothetical protein UX52_C0004G0045 [Candidatus Amesbacteria bacterium GW2011_GWA1_46_35]KKU69604.1 MAG: hypothetical protein UX93_C0001G0189 [Microgenomates group bacterium GW2011_GWC1_47_20]KKU74304.1 MAG: hypothetical protein UX99_C0018G0012 [Candidatus Amesbacteria bacterium GW2011_GWB1_47_26]KKU79609.1 MAG: hypothetical protein UY06_C0017G0018 [Candidatus Amesbacteria bacteriu